MIGASATKIIWIVITALIGMFGISSALEGYSFRKTSVPERVLFIIGGLLCILPETRSDIIGLVVIASLVVFELVMNKRKATAVN